MAIAMLQKWGSSISQSYTGPKTKQELWSYLNNQEVLERWQKYIKTCWKVGILSHIPARLFTQGLANFVALETLRHGTNPFSWASIHVIGALPSLGGSWFGGDYGYGYDAQNKGHFYCAHKVDFRLFEGRQKLCHVNIIPDFISAPLKKSDSYPAQAATHLLNSFLTWYLPKTYTFSSIDDGRTEEGKIAILAFLTPNVKFHVSKERLMKEFERDTSYPEGFAYSTRKWLSPLNSGLPGIIWNSLTYKTVIRMWQQPTQVLWGLAQMASAIGIAALIHRMFLPMPMLQEYRWAVLAGVVTAAI